MTPDPITIGSGTSVAVAYLMMRERGFRHLPVVDDGKLVGILSVTDIGHAGAKVQSVREQPVSAIMTREPMTIRPDTAVEVAAATMASRKFNCLLVTEGDSLVGIVTTYDLLDALARRIRTEG